MCSLRRVCVKGPDRRTNLLPTYVKDKLRKETKGSWSSLYTCFNVCRHGKVPNITFGTDLIRGRILGGTSGVGIPEVR